MKLLLLSLNFWPELTGIGKFNGELAFWLRRRGHDVRVVSAPPYYPEWKIHQEYGGCRYQHENREGVDIYRVPIWVPKKVTGLSRLLHLGSFAFSCVPTLLAGIRWAPDLVLVTEPPLFCAPLALLAAKVGNSVAWIHIQDFEVDAAFELGILRNSMLRSIVTRTESWLLRKFDVTSTISMAMDARLATKGVLKSQRMIWPNWVNTEDIFPKVGPNSVRRELRISDGTIVALYSGNLGKKQGVDAIVDLARAFNSDEYCDVHFVLCGQGAEYERLRSLSSGLSNLSWLPLQPYERLNELLNAADIHLLPQKGSAADLVMPSKLTAIFASGRPVLAMADEGTELYDAVHGRGMSVPPHEPNMFAEALLSLARNQALRKELGRNAHAYAMEHLSMDSVLTNFVNKATQLTSNINRGGK